MTARLRIPRHLYDAMLADLARAHPFAYERVGFCRVKYGANPRTIFFVDYWPVADEHYIPSDEVGALINADAIRFAMQTALSSGDGVFHVHLHPFGGKPAFGLVDDQDIPRIVDSLTQVVPSVPHGMLVFSPTMATARYTISGEPLQRVDRISVVGEPTQIISDSTHVETDRFSRQTFLGAESPDHIRKLRIGIVGLSGGGSHVAQQLSHVGFSDFAVFDPQTIDESNLNRLVGGTEEDVRQKRPKVAIAERVIKAVNSSATVIPVRGRWQDHPEILRSCDIIVGCVDGFDQRRQLEAACRRYLIPLIDIGMDVRIFGDERPRMYGQIVQSMPGAPCLQCIGVLNEDNLTKEAQLYGDAGINPQVVWPNGVLASSAVGLVVNLATGWTAPGDGLIYLIYDGNRHTVIESPLYPYVRNIECVHYPLGSVGDP